MRQPQNLTLFQLHIVADIMKREHSHTVGLPFDNVGDASAEKLLNLMYYLLSSIVQNILPRQYFI